MRLAKEGEIIERPEDILREPYVFEFTGLPQLPVYTEGDLRVHIHAFRARYEDPGTEKPRLLSNGNCSAGRLPIAQRSRQEAEEDYRSLRRFRLKEIPKLSGDLLKNRITLPVNSHRFCDGCFSLLKNRCNFTKWSVRFLGAPPSPVRIWKPYLHHHREDVIAARSLRRTGRLLSQAGLFPASCSLRQSSPN